MFWAKVALRYISSMVNILSIAGAVLANFSFLGRATGEPNAAAGRWSKGYGAAGYSLLTNITKLVPDTTGYPVNYPV
jgi:hypothetical protein